MLWHWAKNLLAWLRGSSPRELQVAGKVGPCLCHEDQRVHSLGCSMASLAKGQGWKHRKNASSDECMLLTGGESQCLTGSYRRSENSINFVDSALLKLCLVIHSHQRWNVIYRFWIITLLVFEVEKTIFYQLRYFSSQ